MNNVRCAVGSFLILGAAFADGAFGQNLFPNLVQNGSFEVVNPQVNIPFWSGGYLFDVPPLNAANGTNVVFIIDGGSGIPNDTMYQTVPTLVGQFYHLTFAARAPEWGTSEFRGPSSGAHPLGPWVVNVTLNGSLNSTFENDTTIWQYFSVDFVASGPTTLGFYCRHNGPEPSGWPMLDDVSVVLVPEPQTLSLLGAGLLAIAFRARRQRGS